MRFTQKLLLLWLFCAIGIVTNAQQITTDIVYDFSQSETNIVNSELQYVYADSSQIITVGKAHLVSDTMPHYFIAAFSYSGNLLWKKYMNPPSGFTALEASGHNNLKKLPNGNYVVAGMLYDNIVANDSLHHPFLYFFSHNGDSVALQTIDKRIWKLGAMNTDDSRHIMMVGLAGRTHTPYYIGIDTLECADSIWIAKYSYSGSSIWEYLTHFGLLYPVDLNKVYAIYDIIWQPSQNHYIIPTGSGQTTGLLQGSSSFYFLAINASPIGTYPLRAFGVVSQQGQTGNFAGFTPQGSQFAACRQKATDNINYICSSVIYYLNYIIIDNTYGSLYPDTLMKNQWYKYLVSFNTDTFFSGRLKGMAINEAANGDILMLRMAVVSQLFSTGYANNFIPCIMRKSNTGDSIWTQYYTHINTNDTNIDQYLNNMAVAPNGNIVLVGSVNSKNPVPGVWDTSGKLSWLIVLKDSLDANVGIQTLPNIDKEITVFPNPASDQVQLNYTGLKFTQLQLIDASGRIVRTYEPQAKQLSVNGIVAGIYWLHITTNKGVAKKKLVIW